MIDFVYVKILCLGITVIGLLFANCFCLLGVLSGRFFILTLLLVVHVSWFWVLVCGFLFLLLLLILLTCCVGI